jgi:N-acetylmuramoyl-L-alanine amidase
MIKIVDKFLPVTSLAVIALFMATFLYLHADTTLQNTNTKPEQEKVSDQVSAKKIKILIVPGHDTQYFGATFKEVKEAEQTLKIANYLKMFLEKDSAFEIYTTRENPPGNLCLFENKNDYTETFQKYFNENREAVLKYRDVHKEETDKFDNQNIESTNTIEHNDAPEEVSYRLYAINKWVEENNIDIVIHLHFDDYPDRPSASDGKFRGFSIFTADESLKNEKTSNILAKEIGRSLKKFFEYSDNPVESLGIIPSHDLIAVGANNTISAASVLIEYGYIYEQKFQDEETLKKAAEQTYTGIKNYLLRKSLAKN